MKVSQITEVNLDSEDIKKVIWEVRFRDATRPYLYIYHKCELWCTENSPDSWNLRYCFHCDTHLPAAIEQKLDITRRMLIN